MDLLIVFSIFLCLRQVNNVQDSILTKCIYGDGKCYTLYRADLTWQEAYDECSSRNHHLATIQDEQIQNIMELFAEDQVYPHGTAHAWVAGRRSDDMTWRDVNGALFNYDGFIVTGEDVRKLCMLQSGLSGLSSFGGLHFAVPCYNLILYKALCEYDPTGSGCPDNDRTIHQPSVNKCNTVSVDRYKSWHDARQYCHSQGWELAHTGAGSWDFYLKLTETEKPPIKGENAFRIGVQRRPWIWMQGDQEIHIKTSYWRSEEGVYSIEGCMHIELNDRGMWADKSCNVTSAYFICEHNKDIRSTAVTTSVNSAPVTIFNTTPISNECECNPQDTQAPECEITCQQSTCYFIVGVIGAILMAENVIFAVVLVRRKRTDSTKQAQLKERDRETAPDYVNVTSDQPSHQLEAPTATHSISLNQVSPVIYNEPTNLVTDNYINTTDGSTVTGHSQNEAYPSLGGQTTPGPNVLYVVHRNHRQYNTVDCITTTDGSTVPGHSQSEDYSSLDGQTKVAQIHVVNDEVYRVQDREYENE